MLATTTNIYIRYICLCITLYSVYGQSSITCVGLGVFDNRSPYDRLPIPHCPEDLGDELVLDYYSTNNDQIGEQVVGIDRTTIP